MQLIWGVCLVVCSLLAAVVQTSDDFTFLDVQTTVVVCDAGCRRQRRDVENDIGEQVRMLIEHYKQGDPVGLPGSPIPDPQNVPNSTFNLPVGKMVMKNQQVHGLSKFRFQTIKADLAKLEMKVGVRVETLLIKGQYTLGMVFQSYSGPFTINITGVYAEGVAALLVDRSGSLTAEDIKMDIRFQNIELDFRNLGRMARIVQGLVNHAGKVVFDGIKPYILKDLNTQILRAMNENIKKIPQRFPNSIPPLDMAVAEFRGKVRALGYDPFHADNLIENWGSAASISLTNVWISGLSTFYRIGEISLGVVNNTANATVHIGTQRIEGRCTWDMSVGFLSRTGTAKFWVNYVKARVSVLQPLNLQRKPEIDKLTLKIGNVQIRVDGAGTLDYIAEFALNVLPNLLRYQLVVFAEDPLRKKIQQELNQVNVEELVLEQLKQFEEAQASAAAAAAAAEQSHVTETDELTRESPENENKDFDDKQNNDDDLVD